MLFRSSPEISYDQIGGLLHQIKEVRESVEYPLTKPEIFRRIGVEPPKGILLYGAPGTGKTLIAKAVAHEAKATFIRMSGSELVHKFIGEGAGLVRELFQLARERAPAIVFIDEIDAVGSMRTTTVPPAVRKSSGPSCSSSPRWTDLTTAGMSGSWPLQTVPTCWTRHSCARAGLTA